MAASDNSVAVSDNTDFSSDYSISDDWQELTKSDYAKVIFSDIFYNAVSGNVECKFQITDSVHEDPNDFVGLFRVGHDDLSQCLVSKMLSHTKCEDDGKLQSCVFTSDELPHLDDGFYQFFYVTRDQEVCGASMPFQMKKPSFHSKTSSGDSIGSDKLESGFFMVHNKSQKKVGEIESKAKKIDIQMKNGAESDVKQSVPQQSVLSERKKEEISTWISQNPDYYSLVDQIKENSFTIDALQQSKDLAMKEVSQLYEVLEKQNAELNQLRTMVAAYEEKTKMSENLLEEKNEELIEMRKKLVMCEDKINLNERMQEEKKHELIQMRSLLTACAQKIKTNQGLQQEKSEAIIEMRKMLTTFEENNKQLQHRQLEKDEQLKQLQNELSLHVEELNSSHVMLDQQNGELSELRKELAAREEKLKSLENLREMFGAQMNEVNQLIVTREEKTREFQNIQKQVPEASSSGTVEVKASMEVALEKTKDLQNTVCSALENMDWKNEAEVEKFFELQVEIVVIQSKIRRAKATTDICNGDGLKKKAQVTFEKSETAEEEIFNPVCPSSSDHKAASIPNSNANQPEGGKKSVGPLKFLSEDMLGLSICVEDIETALNNFNTELISHKNESEASSEEQSVEVLENVAPNLLELDVLVDPIVELPRLEVIDEDAARMLQMEMEDVTLINRLTEKIINRDPNLYTTIELADDSSADSESDLSEIVEKNSMCFSMKKYLFSLARVMKALYEDLPTDTILENLVVVKNEEDRHLLCRKECGALLQKCALRYQTEILFGQIEKQKEGMMELSHRICDLLANCMVLKDELSHSKSACEKLQTTIDKKDEEISGLNKELERKNIAICHVCCENSELKNRAKNAEKTVEDFHARITEAADLYKEQYTEIERLSKKLKKYKSSRIEAKSSKGESSENSSVITKSPYSYPCECWKVRITPAVPLDASAQIFKPSSASFEVGRQDSVQNVSDSDTGEHMFAKSSSVSNEDKQDSKSNNSVQDNTAQSASSPEDTEKDSACSTDAGCARTAAEVDLHQNCVFGNFTSYQDFQDTIKRILMDMKISGEPCDAQPCIICYFCQEVVPLAPDPTPMMNHLENNHLMKMCPVCGELFEDAVPKKYYAIHVNHHFD